MLYLTNIIIKNQSINIYISMQKQSQEQPGPKVTITNIKDLPIYTPYSKKLIKKIQSAQTIKDIEHNIHNWIHYLDYQNYFIDEMLTKIKIKENANKSIQQTYEIQLLPKYQRFMFFHRMTTKTLDLLIYANYYTDLIKKFGFMVRWDYKKKQLKNSFIINGHSPWKILFNFNKSKPLNKDWVADTNKFSFIWDIEPWDKFRELEFDGESGYKTEDPNNKTSQKLFMEIKGYTNRLKQNIENERKAYINSKFMKKVDLFELGYSFKTDFSDHHTMFGFTFSAGTDFQKSHYLKLKQQFSHQIALTDNHIFELSGKGGAVFGKNIPIQQHHCRNSLIWLNERSKSYYTLKGALEFHNLKYLSNLNITPGNYIQMWVSKNQQNKIKVEGEAGISFKMNQNLQVSYELFRLSGVKGEPKFGLKYEF